MSSLQAGYGEKKITPPLGTDLTGFGFYLDRRSRIVRDDLKARALCLKSSQKNLFLISLDLLGLTIASSDRIRRQVAKQHKIPAENVLLACTHTHSGPAAQPLPGLGKINSSYVRELPQAILEAAARAWAAAEEAVFGFHVEAVEPVGYNRRRGDFNEIDPWLKVGIFRQKKRAIYLLNYACHAVTLGPTKEISADWPGALVREIEKAGDRGLVLQGFCGDIDPVTYLNRRLGATKRDYTLSGRILAERAFKSEKYAAFTRTARLGAAEERIRLPLLVFPKKDLARETEAALEANKEFSRAAEIIRAWRKRVEKHHAAFLRSPWLEGVPVHALSVGGMKILGLPGEVFCGLGLKMRSKWPSLMTIGYADGNIGYLPTREAYRTPNDYACYCAPKFYSTFGFAPAVEAVLLKAASRLLSSLKYPVS
jgi:hypothetical protein